MYSSRKRAKAEIVFSLFSYILPADFYTILSAMLPSLRPHTHYTNAGEILSKLLFLKDNLPKVQENILLVVANESIAKKYLLASGDLQIPIRKCENYEDIIDLKNTENPFIYIISPDTLEYSLSLGSLQHTLELKVGQEISMEECMKKLQDLGYEFQEYGKSGSYVRNGDIITIQKSDSEQFQLSFWGDEIESITQNNAEISEISLGEKTILTQSSEKRNIPLLDYLQNEQIFLMLDHIEFHHMYERLSSEDMKYASFDILSLDQTKSVSLGVESIAPKNIEELKTLLGDKSNLTSIYSRHADMLEEFLKENNFGHIAVRSIKNHIFQSFAVNAKNKKNVIICDDIISNIFIKKRVRKKLSADIDLLLKIKNGDHIVHIDHGIGIFEGIIKKQLGTVEKEYLEISYAENDKLFVPITEVQRVSKYIGAENPKLTPLSGKIWEKKMKKVHEDIREIAESILQNFAERKLRKGKAYTYSKKQVQEFQSSFPYSYTQDQSGAIEDIFADMQSDKNMDRLLVGDVGFGKTEIAFNAAYLALQNKKQVVLISPLVVLAHEHFEKAKERFRDFGVKIEVLSRLQSQAHATKVLTGLKDGSIDMVIGTHRLLSDKISYKNLGLLIVDEEHKFGVTDKEKIKNIRSNIDILSLSATPIPRSLNLALSGVRDISLIKTPPGGRKSIKTSVLRHNEALIQEAGNREFERGGQVFFVHNRVSNIEVIRKQLEALFPKKKVIITHGQLPGEELENRILDFKNKKYDILLSTTVIENGIDFSNVNTIFINECQQFGISQIHQLRGRVGRSDTQGYCYLLYRKEHIDGEAAKRIQTIVDYSYLGAGFELAMKDLEIRGGGDILGIRQSGQAKEIGVSLFLKMLEEKIAELKEQKDTEKEVIQSSGNAQKTPKKNIHIDTKIDLMISAGIPDEYFLSETDKLNFYREIEMIEDVSDLEYVRKSLFENNTKEDISEQTENLFLLLELKIFTQKQLITQIRKVGINYQVEFHKDIQLKEVKSFLAKDTLIKFQVVDIQKLRAPAKLFANEKNFIEYLLQALKGKVQNPKIRLAKKHIS